MSKPTKKRKPAATPPLARKTEAFPIVGIGASAGGLEALEQFFRHVPERSGLAFVVVQHQDPTHTGMLAELLQRCTSMKVVTIEDRQRVQPDRVHVIPPGTDLSILRGVLHLLAPAARRGLRLPIDFFLRSLAADRPGRCIGVVLSGMGSDGTLGLGAIQENAGAAFVQAPASAKFDAMPRSAIAAGVADVVAPVEELPARILAYLARAPLGDREPPIGDGTESALQKLCALLRAETGHDFSPYKRSTVLRRVERRMGLRQIDGLARYVAHVRESPEEARLLVKDLLIGVTSFFRDPAAWDHLRTKAIPRLLAERRSASALRAWVAGCSTGEEAYSLAIVLSEAIAEARPARSVPFQIFATDLDKDSIARARQGLYPKNVASDVSPERLRRFFVEEEGGYRVGHEIRETVIFAPHDVTMDPPFTNLDVLSCRNLLIYLEPELQKKLLPLFHYSLRPGGLLVLGSSETVGAATDLFAPVDAKTRIFQRQALSPRAEPVEFPVSFPSRRRGEPAPPKARPDLSVLAERLLLERFSPAAVLTDERGDILWVSGRTGDYLEPAAGKANWNLQAMARKGLDYELGAAFRKAVRDRSAVTRLGMKLASGAAVDVTIEPIREPEALGGTVLVLFAAARAPPAAAARGKKGEPRLPPAELSRVERELERTRGEVQIAREEMQTSQEELRSSNEELQSTNEELQSTNEELTTSKEEMQSLNEELQTLNHELQAKLDELSRANDDMRNLLDSTEIATLFLDDALRVRRFTAAMKTIVKLIPSDVDRPITDLASDLLYPKLGDDAREVLRTLVPREALVGTLDGRWFSVRIMPYRTVDDRIDGVVITFLDSTAQKTLEATLRQKRTTR